MCQGGEQSSSQVGNAADEMRREELKKRVEAAAAYGGITNFDDLADAIGMSRKTFWRRRTENGFSEGELYEIAKACGVPLWFLTDGWKGWLKAATPAELRQLADDLPDVPPDE